MDNVSIKTIQHRDKLGVAFWEITFKNELAEKHRMILNKRHPPTMQRKITGKDSYSAWETPEETKVCIERVVGRPVTDEEFAQAFVWDEE
ncbi:MAG: hypothetical protein CMP20_01870 [Rickettsiales bacterium]|nr:hypothetical protein [Rickettsiales bacterium]